MTVGIDPASIRDAIAAALDPNVLEVDVHAYAPRAPVFPALAVFEGAPFIDYWQTMGNSRAATLNFELRTAFTYGDPEDSLRHLDALCASGRGATRSVIDAIHADVTLGGKVDTCHVMDVRNVEGGADNAGFFERVWNLQVAVRRIPREEEA